jgi:hypothetical protein
MNAWTIGVLVAVNAWFGYVGIRSFKEARRFGPLMMAGVAAGLAAVALGQVAFVLHDRSYAIYAAGLGLLFPILVVTAIRRHMRSRSSMPTTESMPTRSRR